MGASQSVVKLVRACITIWLHLDKKHAYDAPHATNRTLARYTLLLTPDTDSSSDKQYMFKQYRCPRYLYITGSIKQLSLVLISESVLMRLCTASTGLMWNSSCCQWSQL
jgi:hypothetical protein